ncbi:MAG: DUF2806 domain-containing protein [Caldilineaceae bacterium]|nr:DUF2806 domain-containing protein [Caldilineaceae bacterium]
MDVNIKVPALEKLLDYAASGIGSVAGSMLAPWRAGRDARAKLVAAQGEVEAQKILAEGRAVTMQIIAAAQADARSALVSPNAVLQGEITVSDLVHQRIQFQEEKRQANIGSVVRNAAAELGDGEVQEHEVDHDWTARFFNDVQDVSSEEMQKLWGKVLAGEVERPGSTSIKTLAILKNLDKSVATLFGKICSICVSIRPDGNSFMDARVPSLGGNAATNALKDYNLGFGNLNVLNEHGLVISDYNSWYDIRAAIGIAAGGTRPSFVRIPLYFQGKYWVLVPTTQRDLGKEFRLSGVALTKSGQELSRIVALEPADQYAQALQDYFEKDSLRMTEVASWEPQLIPGP